MFGLFKKPDHTLCDALITKQLGEIADLQKREAVMVARMEAIQRSVEGLSEKLSSLVIEKVVITPREALPQDHKAGNKCCMENQSKGKPNATDHSQD